MTDELKNEIWKSLTQVTDVIGVDIQEIICVTTFIPTNSSRIVETEIYEIEQKLIEKYPKLVFDFHISKHG